MKRITSEDLKGKRESVTETLTIPVTPSFKKKWRDLGEEMKRRGYRHINELSRERLDALVYEIEPLISGNEAG